MIRRIGAALVVLAVAAPAADAVRDSWIDWTPLDVPLAEGRRVHQFTVDAAGQYELAVQVDRPAGRSARTAVECRLGFDWVECADGEPMLTLRWGIRTVGGTAASCGSENAVERMVDTRSSSGQFTEAIAQRWLGCADLRSGTRYVLEVEVRSGLADAGALGARLLLLPSAALDRERYSTTAAIWLSSLLAGLAGLLLFLARDIVFTSFEVQTHGPDQVRAD